MDASQYCYVSYCWWVSVGFPQVLVIGNSTAVYVGFSGDSDSKESAWNAGDLSLIPGSGRSPREGNGNPLAWSNPFLPGESHG